MWRLARTADIAIARSMVKVKSMIKPLAITGALFVLIGIAGFVHPRVMMPAKTDVTTHGGEKIIVETRRIVQIPALMSACALLAGGGLIFLSLQKQ
jgi:hypothetical protein